MAPRSSRDFVASEFDSLDQTRIPTQRMRQIAERAFDLVDNARRLASEAIPKDPPE